MVKQFKGVGKRAERGNENNLQSSPAADNRPVGADAMELKVLGFLGVCFS